MALKPLVAAIADHARAGPRAHVDDTPVPVLAPRAQARSDQKMAAKPPSKTRTGRLWTMVRDHRPFDGGAPPAAAYAYSPDRGGEHAETLLGGFAGIMQADAFPGFNRLYEKGAIVEAACWAHGRRKFYELAQLKKAPIAIEAVARIDALYTLIETCKMNGVDPRAWLADVLDRLPGHPARRIDELLPWNWKPAVIDGCRMRIPTLSATEKEAITAACQAFIDTVLKPRFLPVITPTQFNYPVDIQGKWHGSKYRFLQRYRSGFSDNLGEEFDAPFTRLDWMGRDRFDVQWHRHTGQWFLIHQGLPLKAALNAIETDEFLHPV